MLVVVKRKYVRTSVRFSAYLLTLEFTMLLNTWLWFHCVWPGGNGERGAIILAVNLSYSSYLV